MPGRHCRKEIMFNRPVWVRVGGQEGWCGGKHYAALPGQCLLHLTAHTHTHTQEKLYSLRIWLRLTNVSQLGRSPGAHSSNEAKMLLCLLLWCVRRTHRLLITPYYSPQPWKFDLSSLCYCTEEFDYFDTVFENYVSSRPVWACAATGRLMWYTQVRHFPGSTSFAGPETTFLLTNHSPLILGLGL